MDKWQHPPPPPNASLFAAPRPIRQLFKLFPLQVREAEPLPARSPDRPRARAELHVFSTDDDAARGLPSYNPACLKWQTLLRIAGLQTDLVPSNNHASPSGALPFLLLPSSSSDSRPDDIPLAGDRIAQYAREQHPSLAWPDERPLAVARQQAYASLLAQNIRPAWLYTLYLDPVHTALLSRLYLPRPPLRDPLLRSLRAAATREILQTTRRRVVRPSQVYRDAEAALAALSALLGDQEWFSGEPSPGLFDADVFAYTYLIGDDRMGWQDGRLAECLAGCGNLVAHATRLYERYWLK
ncbi:hypothetical protein EsDP_00006182 [Epichloe bromicola]|uniref:Mitochondrial outer membrane protein n=1 Tax=Epichloe bromicola TaxID=79588 RepID=A0ABQ0CWX3_9HYPO